MVNISGFSLAELKELELLIPKEIRQREVEEKAKVRKELEAMASSRGFSLNQLFGGNNVEKRTRRSSGRAGKPVEPKYRHPQKPELQWSGRGRKPVWVENWLSNGGTLAQLVI